MDDQDVADMLFIEGDELMTKLGMKQDENFQWNEADLDWCWKMAKERGIAWLRDEADRRSRSTGI